MSQTSPAVGSMGNTIGAVTVATAQFYITVTKTVGAITYYTGEASIQVANSGTCDAVLTSLLVFMETPMSPGKIGNSYGPSGSNYQLWAVSGVENVQKTFRCDAQEQSSVARICEATACNVAVPYNGSLIVDKLTNLTLDLSTYTVPKASTRTLQLATTFAVNRPLTGTIPSAFRISSAVTFDACCSRGSS